MSILAFLAPLITKALDLIPDPQERANQLQSIMSAMQEWDRQQVEVNKAEAANASLFVSGWRPFIGWVCGISLAYQYLLIPFVGWGLAVSEITVPPLPTLDNNLWQLMFGMLGMGGLRTFEKMKGVARE